MRVAILADIHGNLPALNAVLDDAMGQKITTFWCLGDVVGYGPWPIQCWAALQKLDIAPNAWVVGNHDLGLVDGLCGGQYFSEEYFDQEARTVLNYHRQVCRTVYPEICPQIEQTQVIAQPKPGVILAHGVPKPADPTWTVTKYTTGKVDAEQAVTDLLQADFFPQLIVVGHSHRALFWRRVAAAPNPESEWQEETPQGQLALGNLSRQIVYLNPGSVGQPRDEGYEASYCYLDWHRMTVCFRRVSYALDLTRRKMIELGYPQTLIDKWYTDPRL
ncbi:MAG: metallophosphoesterase family protein [Anaerolineae bacterium]|nr:metallophosphoesterase family protein [Anaerolineae bacterium]